MSDAAIEESNLVRHAREEMRRAGLYDEDADYEGMIPPAVMGVVERFAADHHSGGSAALVLAILDKVLRFQPLTPLTNDPAEWQQVEMANLARAMWQSRRQHEAFSHDGGRTYYLLDDRDTVLHTEPHRL